VSNAVRDTARTAVHWRLKYQHWPMNRTLVVSGNGLLQLCQVIQRSVNKADHCVYCNGREKIKLEEEAISEILITDTKLGIKKYFLTRESQ